MPLHAVHLNSVCPGCLLLPDPVGTDTCLPACIVARGTPHPPALRALFHLSATHVSLYQFAESNAAGDLCYHHDQPLVHRRWQFVDHLYPPTPLMNYCRTIPRSLLPHTLELQPGSRVPLPAIPPRGRYSGFPQAT